MSSEFNDSVVSAALGDVRGALGIGSDAGTWIDSLFTSGLACGMAFAPWCAVTFSLRRFALFAIAFALTATVLIPLAPNTTAILCLRALQGFAGGLTIPLLMMTALKVLPPPIRLYGLAVYALTATFTLPISTTLTALWTDVIVSWQLVFFASIPLSAAAALFVWYGLPAEPAQYQRLRQFDWRGAILIFIGFGSLSTLLIQGDRFDWFNSRTMSLLAVVSATALPLLLLNEWYHPLPLLKLQMVLRRNFAYGMLGLFGFLVISTSGTVIPLSYLAEVKHYRPIQSYPVTLVVALGQFAMLPAMAFLLDHKRVDSRLVTLCGLALMFVACLGCYRIDASWNDNQFYAWEILQTIGQPMVVMPLLMMATNAVLSPADGPFASALINVARALGEPVGTWTVDLIQRWRGGLHSDRLVDTAGLDWFRTIRGVGTVTPGPLRPNGAQSALGSLARFGQSIAEQASVLTIADAFLVMAALTLLYAMVVMLLPERTYPPRLLFAKH